MDTPVCPLADQQSSVDKWLNLSEHRWVNLSERYRVMVVLLVEMVLLDMAVVVLVVLVLRIYMTMGVSASPPVVFWLRFATVSP